jgi:hypothetical protein
MDFLKASTSSSYLAPSFADPMHRTLPLRRAKVSYQPAWSLTMTMRG